MYGHEALSLTWLIFYDIFGAVLQYLVTFQGKAEVFQISHFYWSFSSGIMTVKGLMLFHMLTEFSPVHFCRQVYR